MSIHNLTVEARSSSDRGNYETRASDQQTNQPSFVRNSHFIISHQTPFTAMQSHNRLPWQCPLDFRSRLCLRRLAWPRNPAIESNSVSLSITQLQLYPIGSQKVVAMATFLSCRVSAISVFCRLTTQTLSISNHPVVIFHTKSIIAILITKLVAIATSLRPSTLAMSSSDSLIPKTYP